MNLYNPQLPIFFLWWGEETMITLMHKSTCEEEKTVIDYIDKTKGCIPVWKQDKLAIHG